MNIIIVGCDGTGKTSVVERLQEELGYEVRKGSSFEIVANKTSDEIFDTLSDLIYDENVIFDRFSYCNYVYAPLYNDYSRLTKEHVRFLERELKGCAIVVHLTATNKTILERFAVRGEDYVTADKLTAIKLGYEEILEDCTLPLFTYKTDTITTEQIVEDILDIVNGCELELKAELNN